jgi:hypothetical protein
MRRLVLVLALVAGCHGKGDAFERHGSAGPGSGDPGAGGEYGSDPGRLDAGSAGADVDAELGAPPDATKAIEAAVVEAAVVELPLSMLATEVARVACQRRLACCAPGAPGLPADQAGCQQALDELLQPYADEVTRSVGDDRATYDGVALAHCLAQLTAMTCDQARTWEPLLVGSLCPFVAPTLGEGDACRSSYECRNGFCAGVSGSHDGRCTTPRLANGQPCDRGDDCASGTCHATLDVCAPPTPGNLCD